MLEYSTCLTGNDSVGSDQNETNDSNDKGDSARRGDSLRRSTSKIEDNFDAIGEVELDMFDFDD